MKYCPYCGAELIPGALSFCPECGKALPVPAERTMPQDQAPPSRQRKEKPPKERKPKAPHKSKPAPEPVQPDLDYDGYYDDVPPGGPGPSAGDGKLTAGSPGVRAFSLWWFW